MAVVHLQNLDVEFGPKRLGHLLGEARQQIHAEAHIAGLDDGGVTRGGRDLGLVVWREAGRADDMDDAGLSGEPGENRRRFRAGKIEHGIDAGEKRHRIIGDDDSFRRQSGELADIAADAGRTLGLEPSGNDAALGLGEHARERLAHTASGAKYSDLHCSHE